MVATEITDREESITITAIEPAWVEQKYEVTSSGHIEPVSASVAMGTIDFMHDESTYHTEDGLDLCNWRVVEDYAAALGESPEKGREYLIACGIIDEVEEDVGGEDGE